MANNKPAQDVLDAMLTRIAENRLGIITLETRKSDRLDFHDVNVASLKDALMDAYNAGASSMQPTLVRVFPANRPHKFVQNDIGTNGCAECGKAPAWKHHT